MAAGGVMFKRTGIGLLLAPLAQAVPTTVVHQGRLTTAAGQPYDGTVSATFTLHSDPNAASGVWTETHPSVAVQDGYYAVVLGNLTPLDQAVLTGAPRYLGVAVGSDPELAPRTGPHQRALRDPSGDRRYGHPRHDGDHRDDRHDGPLGHDGHDGDDRGHGAELVERLRRADHGRGAVDAVQSCARQHLHRLDALRPARHQRGRCDPDFHGKDRPRRHLRRRRRSHRPPRRHRQ
jgi:hypothetical protein